LGGLFRIEPEVEGRPPLRSALVDLPVGYEGPRKVLMTHRLIRLEGDGLTVSGDRVRQLALPPQDDPQVVVDGVAIWPQGPCRLIEADRFRCVRWSFHH